MPFPYQPVPYLFGLSVDTIMLTIGFIVFFIVVERRLRKAGIAFREKDYIWFYTGLIFTALLGGRIWHAAEMGLGWKSLIEIFYVRKPGLTSWGMLVGGALFLVIYALVRSGALREKGWKGLMDARWQIELGRTGDAIAPAIALWIFIYRIGCQFWNHAPGTITTVPWALYHVNEGVLRHPTALYLSLNGLFIFFLLTFAFKRNHEKGRFWGKRFDGEVILWFIALYAFNRFWIEFFRANLPRLHGLNAPQWVGMAVVVVMGYFLLTSYLEMNEKEERIGNN